MPVTLAGIDWASRDTLGEPCQTARIHFRGHIHVHCRYGPVTRDLPEGDLVDRLQDLGFPPPCYPNYGAPDCCPGRSLLLLNTPAFAGHTTGLDTLASSGSCHRSKAAAFR